MRAKLHLTQCVSRYKTNIWERVFTHKYKHTTDTHTLRPSFLIKNMIPHPIWVFRLGGLQLAHNNTHTHTHTSANTDRQPVGLLKLRPPTVCWEFCISHHKEQMVLLLHCSSHCDTGTHTQTHTYTSFILISKSNFTQKKHRIDVVEENALEERVDFC